MSGELLLLPDFDHHSPTPGFPQIAVANRYSVQRTDIPIERPIRRQAVAMYTSGEHAKGCMVMSTAVAAAVCHSEIQADLLSVIRGLDKKMAMRFQQASEAGQLPSSFDIADRAAIAQSLLHSLSLRARAGETQTQLRRLVKSGVEMIVS